MSDSNKVLFSCTTFLSKPNKYDELNHALDTFIKFNDIKKIDYFIVINEYGENTEEKVEKLKKKYPFIFFINKEKEDAGQANSLNLIITILKEYNVKYWLHWEESWFTISPFLEPALNIIKNNHIDQLQLTDDMWRSKKSIHYHTITHKDYLEAIPESMDIYKTYFDWQGKNFEKWPLFSLRPGIDKVEKILEVGFFDNSPEKWPVTFEFDYALRWIRTGARKGILTDLHVTRKENHQSTY